MTNGLALTLAVMILGAILLDLALVGDDHLVFLGKKFFTFLEWLAFWR